jgi:hypothetical protein
MTLEGPVVMHYISLINYVIMALNVQVIADLFLYRCMPRNQGVNIRTLRPYTMLQQSEPYSYMNRLNTL